MQGGGGTSSEVGLRWSCVAAVEHDVDVSGAGALGLGEQAASGAGRRRLAARVGTAAAARRRHGVVAGGRRVGGAPQRAVAEQAGQRGRRQRRHQRPAHAAAPALTARARVVARPAVVRVRAAVQTVVEQRLDAAQAARHLHTHTTRAPATPSQSAGRQFT